MADIAGKSFIATLLSTTGDGFFPVGYLTDTSVAGDGWLIQSTQEQHDAVFRFDFIETVGDRIHYTISAAPGTAYEGAKVGISRNGYLGFYRIAEVADFWKIELEGSQADPEAFEFVLRDHRGYRVGSVSEPQGGFWTSFHPAQSARRVRFLNVEAGDIVHFRGEIITEL